MSALFCTKNTYFIYSICRAHLIHYADTLTVLKKNFCPLLYEKYLFYLYLGPISYTHQLIIKHQYATFCTKNTYFNSIVGAHLIHYEGQQTQIHDDDDDEDDDDDDDDDEDDDDDDEFNVLIRSNKNKNSLVPPENFYLFVFQNFSNV